MSKDRKSDRYEVGYGKPPQHTRFVRGQIGNPKGRPKGSKNFKTLLLAELMTVLPIVENNRRKKITKQGAVVKQLVNRERGDTNTAAYHYKGKYPTHQPRANFDFHTANPPRDYNIWRV